jgi:hypothetical protein
LVRIRANIRQLIVARVLQGIGGTLLVPAAWLSSTLIFPRRIAVGRSARGVVSFANNASGFISCRDTFITMMEAAEFCDRYDHAMFHNLMLDGALFAECQMWA